MIKPTMKRVLAGLNRRGVRWMLELCYSAAGRFVSNGPKSVRFKDGGWVHRFGSDYLVESRPRIHVPEIDCHVVEGNWGFLYHPKTRDTVVDVGAGYGWEALYYGRKVGPSGRVIAIEAHPTLSAMMARSVSLSGLSQVTPLGFAVSDKAETLFIEDDLQGHIGNAVNAHSKAATIPVEARTVDQLMGGQGVGQIDFLKMNIEGAERLAIGGMANALKRIKVIVISCHDFKFEHTGNDFFRTKRLVETFLRKHGFALVPRSSEFPWLRDQVNAYNPALVEMRDLATVATATQ